MLAALAGRSHRVLTAVAVSAGTAVAARDERHAGSSSGHCRRSRSMPMSTAANRRARLAPMRSRAAPASWVKRIDGSYSGVMGLPLHDAALLLRRAGLRI